MKTTGERFRRVLEDSGLDFHFTLYDGKHLWRDWKKVIAEALRVQLGGEGVVAVGP